MDELRLQQAASGSVDPSSCLESAGMVPEHLGSLHSEDKMPGSIFHKGSGPSGSMPRFLSEMQACSTPNT